MTALEKEVSVVGGRFQYDFDSLSSSMNKMHEFKCSFEPKQQHSANVLVRHFSLQLNLKISRSVHEYLRRGAKLSSYLFVSAAD